MELGISTVDIENFRRLTPEVVMTEKDSWHVEYSSTFIANELNKENFNYCLALLIDFLLKKQKMESGRRYPRMEKSIPAPPIYIGKPVFKKPSQQSEKISFVKEDHYYSVDKIVTGFDLSECYLYVHLYPQRDQFVFEDWIWGYLLVEEH